MNLKKFVSLLFVLLLGAGSVAFAANNTRNVYSVYSDNFNGAHFYGDKDEHGTPISIPSSDEDGMKEYHWNQKMVVTPQTSGVVEGVKYSRYTIPANVGWDVIAYTPVTGTSTLNPRNMTAYLGGSLKFLVRSSYSSFSTAYVGFQCRRNGSDILVYKTLGSLNFNNNGTWQDLAILLNTTDSFNIKIGNNPPTTGTIDSSYLENVIALFIFQPITLTEDDYLDIDNIRWVKSGDAATFSVKIKNVSDNSEVSDQMKPISFSEDSFGQGWTVADQYLEMDFDGEFTGNNWVIRAYTNNDKAGLYNISDTSDVLPTAWKVSCSTLPYVYTDYNDQGTPFQNKNTLEIGEKKSQSGEFYGLYDQGKVDFLHDTGVEWLFPWFFVKTAGDTSAQSIICNNQGCHTFENTDAGGIVHEYYDALTDFHERKPKLFFACDTKKAIAAKYTASFTISLSYE